MEPPVCLNSRLSRIRATRVAIRPPSAGDWFFDLAASLTELSREGGLIRLGYSLLLETSPAVLRAEMAGEASFEAGALREGPIESQGEAFVSGLAMEIFRVNYQQLYLLLETMGLKAPTPQLLMGVHLTKERTAGASGAVPSGAQ
jgi:hypothetical protein